MSLQKHCNQVGSLIADKNIGIYMGHLLNNFVFCDSVCSAPKASAAKDKNKDTVGNTDMNKDTVENTDVNKDTAGNTDVNKDTVENTDVNKDTAGNTDVNKDTAGNTDVNKDTVGNTDVNKDTVGNSDVNKDTVGNSDVDTISKRKRKLTRKNDISMYILHAYATTCDLNA